MTALYDTYKDDYLFFDDIEEVTVEDSGTSVSGVKALRSPVPLRMLMMMRAGGEVGIDQDAAIFTTWDTTMGGLETSSGSRITDANGVLWTVKAAQQISFSTRWKNICVAGK